MRGRGTGIRNDEFRTRQVIRVHPLEEFLDLRLCGVAECYLVVDSAGADECFVEFFGVVGRHYLDFVSNDFVIVDFGNLLGLCLRGMRRLGED